MESRNSIRRRPSAQKKRDGGWGIRGMRYSASEAKRLSISGPRVAVAPIAFSSDTPGLDYLAAGTQSELVGILAEFDWLTVFPIKTGPLTSSPVGPFRSAEGHERKAPPLLRIRCGDRQNFPLFFNAAL